MHFIPRIDIGGRAVCLPALAGLSEIEISKPILLIVGGNGSGKSSLLAMLRQATGLVGNGLGQYANEWGKPLRLPDKWDPNYNNVDWARHQLLVEADRFSSQRSVGKLPECP